MEPNDWTQLLKSLTDLGLVILELDTAEHRITVGVPRI